jgi:excisionase family DNA binding protein
MSIERQVRENMEAERGEVRLLLSPRDAAKALCVCEKTLWTLTKQGEIPVVRMGRSVRYSLDDLKLWITDRSRNQNTECPNRA